MGIGCVLPPLGGFFYLLSSPFSGKGASRRKEFIVREFARSVCRLLFSRHCELLGGQYVSCVTLCA